MTIRSLLRHRATVVRSVSETDGTSSWVTVTVSLPCLLDASTTGQSEAGGQQQSADRLGTLFTSATSDVQAGDRLIMARGQVGTFVVQPDPATVATLSGPHHREHQVFEVPS